MWAPCVVSMKTSVTVGSVLSAKVHTKPMARHLSCAVYASQAQEKPDANSFHEGACATPIKWLIKASRQTSGQLCDIIYCQRLQ